MSINFLKGRVFVACLLPVGESQAAFSVRLQGCTNPVLGHSTYGTV